MNLNEQLRQAYESGRRQALNEYHPEWTPAQFVDGQMWDNIAKKYKKIPRPAFSPNAVTARNALWKRIIEAQRAGDRTLLKQLLTQARNAGYITGAVMNQLLGASSWAAFSAILVAALPWVIIAALIAAGIAFPGYGGIDPAVEFGPNSGIHPDVRLARHPDNFGTHQVIRKPGQNLPKH